MHSVKHLICKKVEDEEASEWQPLLLATRPSACTSWSASRHGDGWCGGICSWNCPIHGF